MVNENRLPHALLFTGYEGSGNLATSVAFAQYLFCSNKKADDSCGVCPSCVKTSKLVHPDLHFVFPIAKSKQVKSSADLIKEFREIFLENPYLSLNDWFEEIAAENKQPLIPVEESGHIIRELSYTSYEGLYKVMIIWQPEKMNTEAANKLLKVLEEPPEQTIFLLACDHPDQLLATILSRVQQIPFSRLSEQEIIHSLITRFGVTNENASQAAYLCNGNYNEARKLLTQNDEHLSLLQHFRTFMLLALNFDCGKALQWIDENAATGREKQKQFLHYSLEIFRDCLMYNFGSRDLVRLNGNERQFLEKFSPYITQKNYEALIEEFNSNCYYIERNANPKILFMDLLMKTNELINKR